MKYFEKHPLPLVITGVIGVSLSAIFVRYSQAPALITATYRLISNRSDYDAGSSCKQKGNW